MLDWERRKREAIERLRDHIERRRVDEDIISLLETINKIPYAYTTSSCSGRIQLYEAQLPGEKFSMRTLGKWHSSLSEKALINAMRGENIWLAVLPPILHIYTCNLSSSVRMLNLLRASGFKRAGLTHLSSRGCFIEAIGTERLEVPMRLHGRDLISGEGIELIVGVANSLLWKSKARLAKLEVVLRDEASRSLDNLCGE